MYYPLSSNIDTTGKKLFARMTGIPAVSVPANSSHDFDYILTYDEVKINSTEVIGCNAHDTVDFMIYDTDTGTYTTVPNFLLNQYGFGVNLKQDFHSFHSEYPGTLNVGMKVRVRYHNNSNSATTVSVNLRIHELK